MMEGRNYYAVDAVASFVAALTDGSPGSVERCDLTRMSTLYTRMVSRVDFNQRGSAWVESELVRARSEIWKLRSVSKKIFLPHCSFRLCRLISHLLNHATDDSEKFGSLCFTDAE